MIDVLPNAPIHELNRRYLSIKRRIDNRPLESYFTAPLDLIEERDKLYVTIKNHQINRKGVK